MAVDIIARTLAAANSGEGGGSTIDVDDHLSTTSENPVQNKVITKTCKEIKDEIFDIRTGEKEFLSIYLLGDDDGTNSTLKYKGATKKEYGGTLDLYEFEGTLSFGPDNHLIWTSQIEVYDSDIGGKHWVPDKVRI